MASLDPASVNPPAPHSPERQLAELFGAYKAEWLREQIFELFTEPAYFPELAAPGSCILIGGRGTGKTTVLRGLSYQGQRILSHEQKVCDWPYFGLYYRVNTNHVTAFSGADLPDSAWVPLFGHYANLLLCELLLDLIAWYEIQTGELLELDPDACLLVAISLHLGDVTDHHGLRKAIVKSRATFEAYINNVADERKPPISLQGAPIDRLVETVLHHPVFAGKRLFFLIDEYENLLDYQQQVFNTLIKHASTNYTFKIGVKELGWRVRTTLNANEQLIHPADYRRINISEKLDRAVFRAFASDVCNARLRRVRLPGSGELTDIAATLPGMTEDDEAQQLGVNAHVAHLPKLLEHVFPDCANDIQGMTELELYWIKTASEHNGRSIEEEYQARVADRTAWNTQFATNKHALLYTLQAGKRGIRKYYAGWDTFVRLAEGNIRYILELVDQSLLFHLREGRELGPPVSPETQTRAAQHVGRKNLLELEGLTVEGAQLTKLLLGLGRVFQVLASAPVGHAPEVNQFHLGDQSASDSEVGIQVEGLVRAAVMHLALVRFAGTKLLDDGNTRDYDYMVHPIFCPFFVFSYRRKRKLILQPEQLLDLIRSPKRAIRRILESHNRVREGALPEQMLLFERLFDADS